MTRRVYYNLGDDDDGRETFLFEVDDLHYQTVASNLTSGDTDLDDAFEKALAMLSANVRIGEELIDENILEAQIAATATVWFLLNEASDEEDRIEGDILLVEKDGDIYVTNAPAGMDDDDDGDEPGDDDQTSV